MPRERITAVCTVHRLMDGGYAFLRAPDGMTVFLHASEFGGEWPPSPGAAIECAIVETDRGPRARRARLCDPHLSE